MLNYARSLADKDPGILIEKIARFFDATSDAVVFLDCEYKFTFLNRCARELISPDGKALGASLFEFFPDSFYVDSPCVESYRRTMLYGEVSEFESFYPEPLNMWLRVQSYPAPDGIIIFFRNVTQEKLNRESLSLKNEESKRQLSEIETLYRTAPIGLALFDVKDFRYLRLNDRQAQFFGLKPEQIIGHTLTELAPIEGLRELFERVAKGEAVVNYPLEGELATSPGEHRYWTVSYFPVFAADGSIRAITAASLEITQQKKAEQALIQSEKLVAVGRLASSIAHEINNPLESVTNLLFLARSCNNLEQVHAYLDTAEVELRRVSVISNQTLRFHKQSSSPQDICFETLIDGILSVYQGRIINAHVTVEKRLRPHRPVRCFEGEIRQVISNLISNAIDALPRSGGRLLIRCREAMDWRTGAEGIGLTIADSGTGISPEVQSKLFDPFFTTKGIGGTGLGLWVSKEIIDRHHGHLRVRSSQAPTHRGTVFTLFLPLIAVDR